MKSIKRTAANSLLGTSMGNGGGDTVGMTLVPVTVGVVPLLGPALGLVLAVVLVVGAVGTTKSPVGGWKKGTVGLSVGLSARLQPM